MRGLGDAVYAVNCGGEAHTDLFGIKVAQETSFQGPNKFLSENGPCVNKYFQYEKDTNKVGTASDYGKQLMIGDTNKSVDVICDEN